MITGGYVNDLHLMLGCDSDMDNGAPKVTTTSENTLFLNWESGDVYVFTAGSWQIADDAVAGIVAALLNKGALPAVTVADNGKILGVDSGVWAAVSGGGGGSGMEQFLVTFTYSGGSFSCNKTYSEISAAVTAGKYVEATMTLNGATYYGPLAYIYSNTAYFTVFQVEPDGAINAYVLTRDGSAAGGSFARLHPGTSAVSGATPTITAADNMIYTCGELTSLTITDSAQDISFTVDFTSGATATTLSVPDGYKAPGGDLTPEANKTYELNVRNGKAVLTAFEAVSSGA